MLRIINRVKCVNGYKRFLHLTPRLNSIIYTDTKEWLYETKEFTKIGLSKEALEEMGELVFVEFPNVSNDNINSSEELALIESVKATSSVFSPYNCKIIENNIELLDNLENINNNPECIDNSWFLKIRKN
ncbi:Glycine cleavage H-protein [seawater metagenome]|uniref:Glycine cleavage H-protein n=1 Tax=seawater metagenome TaxID=1561972 RepID=A0A5E8CJQ5_9ZZZZ